MTQNFKGVIWQGKTAETEGRTLHKYVVVGLLVTDKKIPEFENLNPNSKNEFHRDGLSVVDASSSGLAELLANLPKRDPNILITDSGSVLQNLREI